MSAQVARCFGKSASQNDRRHQPAERVISPALTIVADLIAEEPVTRLDQPAGTTSIQGHTDGQIEADCLTSADRNLGGGRPARLRSSQFVRCRGTGCRIPRRRHARHRCAPLLRPAIDPDTLGRNGRTPCGSPRPSARAPTRWRAPARKRRQMALRVAPPRRSQGVPRRRNVACTDEFRKQREAVAPSQWRMARRMILVSAPCGIRWIPSQLTRAE